jgi:hypothetical protein
VSLHRGEAVQGFNKITVAGIRSGKYPARSAQTPRLRMPCRKCAPTRSAEVFDGDQRKYSFRLAPSKASRFHATSVEMPSRSARAWIVATELFDEFLIAVHEPETAFDLRLGWETFSTLAGDLESTVGRCVWLS